MEEGIRAERQHGGGDGMEWAGMVSRHFTVTRKKKVVSSIPRIHTNQSKWSGGNGVEKKRTMVSSVRCPGAPDRYKQL